MTRFAVAGIQMNLSAVHSNMDAMYNKLHVVMARFPWIEMVVFSELAALGPNPANAQPMPGGPTEEAFQKWAKHFNIWLIPGSIFETHEGHVYNTTPIINPQGEVVDRYRKMFPFLPYEKGVSAGDRCVVFDVPDVGRFGISICYDMWFPETTRTLAAMGAEVILHPAFTDTIDRDVEVSIARASAATNQCYFFDVNGVGDGGNGRSSVISPSGHVLHECRTSEEVFPIEISLDRVRNERQTGILGLGQPLKSFRDNQSQFDVYKENAAATFPYLTELGPMALPHQRRKDRSQTGDL